MKDWFSGMLTRSDKDNQQINQNTVVWRYVKREIAINTSTLLAYVTTISKCRNEIVLINQIFDEVTSTAVDSEEKNSDVDSAIQMLYACGRWLFTNSM